MTSFTNPERVGNFVNAVPYDRVGAVYVSSFSAIAVTVAQDVFELNIHSTCKNAFLREIRLGQYSDAGDSAAEMLSVRILKGYTVSGSGGAAGVVSPIDARSAAGVSTVEINNTTVANTGTAITLCADSFNIQGGWLYQPGPSDRPRLVASDRLVVRITAPTDALTMNGTIIFEETV